ncbi:uncharacterized protein (TIGR04222 family) [Herbihabitans rhizosphaerae]|uniref:Uncharacterized protein (TIGR04222 family) n=1 Tax=Herbihabitans rhizosphaerae TaxID=1872711 RepID=A0A4Q7KQ31_9PSEU|nr:TIGR04222 domain-containing membrane protein [Herbihabitans rhizosphaerae]RZS38899.1 uncharacterized protein (TIGR04222 family) [Herbihabitans rhizosphaerae]
MAGYLIALGVAAVLALAASWFLRRWPWSKNPPDDLGVYEIAMLAGGPRRVEHTALAGLAISGAIRIGRDGRVRRIGEPDDDDMQRHVLSRLGSKGKLSRRRILGERDLKIAALVSRLTNRGYLASSRALTAARHSHWLVLAVAVVGFFLLSGELTGWLVLGATVAAVVWLSTLMVVTRGGMATSGRGVAQLQAVRDSLAGVSGMSPYAAAIGDLVLVAMVGIAAYPDAEVASIMEAQTDTGGWFSGGDGSDGGGDSDGGGGSDGSV